MDKILLVLEELKKVLLLQKEIFTVEELSMYTGYSVDYIYKLVHLRELSVYKPSNGRKLFFKKVDVIDWITSNKIDSNQDLDAKSNSYLMAKKFGI